MRIQDQLTYRRDVMELLQNCRVTDCGHLVRFELCDRYAVFSIPDCTLDYYVNHEKQIGRAHV